MYMIVAVGRSALNLRADSGSDCQKPAAQLYLTVPDQYRDPTLALAPL